MNHKDKIFELRKEGKSYRDIQSILACSKGTIAYHLGKGQKDKVQSRTRRYRASNPLLSKSDAFKGRKNSKAFENSIDGFQRERKGEQKRVVTFHWKDVINKHGINTKCYLTGRPINLDEPRTYAFDHIIPVSRGGDNSLDNLGISCIEANNAKSNLMPEEFLALCIEILKHKGYQIVAPQN